MLTDEQIGRMNSHDQYWSASNREAQTQVRQELRALAATPSQMLPFFSIEDYEKYQKGQPVPLEQPKPLPIMVGGKVTDNRSLSQYIAGTKPFPPSALTISQYLEAMGDPAPLYMFCC
jgi:hypothetical protein